MLAIGSSLISEGSYQSPIQIQGAAAEVISSSRGNCTRSVFGVLNRGYHNTKTSVLQHGSHHTVEAKHLSVPHPGITSVSLLKTGSRLLIVTIEYGDDLWLVGIEHRVAKQNTLGVTAE